MHRPVKCPQNCGKDLERRHVNRHLTNDCGMRDVKCEFCNESMKAKEEVGHLQQCNKFLVPCPNGCKRKHIKREQVSGQSPTDSKNVFLIFCLDFKAASSLGLRMQETGSSVSIRSSRLHFQGDEKKNN